MRANVLKQQALHSPLWDGVFIFSGIWFCAILWACGIGTLHDWAYLTVLLTFVSAVHVLAPIFLMFYARSLAGLRMQDVRTFFIKPALIVTVTGACVFLFFSAAPGPLKTYGLLFSAAAYVIANSRHISRQHYGILVLYKNRVGEATVTSRRIDSAVCWASNIFLLLIWFDQLRLMGSGMNASAILLGPGLTLSRAVIALGLITGCAFIAYELMQKKVSYYRLFYGVLLAAQPLAALYAPFLTGVAFVWQHMTAEIGLSAQALRQDGVLKTRRFWGVTAAAFGIFAVFLTFARNIPAVDEWVRSGATQLSVLSPADHMIATVAASGMFAFFFLHVYTDTVIYKSRGPILKAIIDRPV